MARAKKTGSNVKPTVKKRTLNVTGVQKNETAAGQIGSGETQGAPFHEQDPERRLGNFEGAGEHSRRGGRRTGIVGQTTKTFRANKKGR